MPPPRRRSAASAVSCFSLDHSAGMVFHSGGLVGKRLRSAVWPASGLQSFTYVKRSLEQESTSLTSIQLQRSSASLIRHTWQIHKYVQNARKSN